ncbi:MAG: hypothetical protein HY422_02465 [Candidatus Komeilibacteria bacterium]|nr:hypothetical protein [Candidatus Komeilibacteria bacterium]
MNTQTQTSPLHDNACIATASFSQWRPKIVDKKISREVSAQHGTDENAGDFLKQLFPTTKNGKDTVQTYPELHAVLGALASLYQWHASNTLVWDGKGRRLLPAVSADEHKARFDAVIANLPCLLDAMEAGYFAAMERARVALNGMFRERDYPTPGELRAKFAVSVVYDPVPQVVTSNLPASVLGLINSQIENRVTAATEGAMNDAWARLYSCVEKFQAKLSTPGAIFRDSLVGNLREVTDVLKRLNVTGSAELEAMRAKVQTELAKYDPETLRDNENLRLQVADTASNVLSAIRGTRTISKVEDD